MCGPGGPCGRPQTVAAPGPFNFRGCDLTVDCFPATEEVRVQFPAAAPNFLVAHQLVRQSLQNSACLEQHQGDLPLSLGPAEKRSACLASSVKRERYPPDPTNFKSAWLASRVSFRAFHSSATNRRW